MSNTPQKANQGGQADHEKKELKQLEAHLIAQDPEIFKGISPKKREKILQSFMVIEEYHMSHSGPLPDPESLKGYDVLIPNGADRIMKMAENQQKHRIGIEKKAVGRQTAQSLIGQIFGFLIGVFGIYIGYELIMAGHAGAGGLLSGGTIIALVSVFVIGKRQSSRNLNSKDN